MNNLIEKDVITFDIIFMDIPRRSIKINGKPVFLRNKEFLLLEYFLRNSGIVLNRTQILESVWDRNIFCPTNTVDVHVGILRRKLKPFSIDGYIRTVHCVGYVFGPNY